MGNHSTDEVKSSFSSKAELQPLSADHTVKKDAAEAWEWRHKQLWLNWGMMILCSDTTSFGLLLACIPRLPAGKIPPRDPKIYDGPGCSPGSREVGHSQGKRERGRAWGRAASLDKLVSTTALRRQSDWQHRRNVNLSVSVCMTNSLKAMIRENKSYQMHRWPRVTYGLCFFCGNCLFLAILQSLDHF